MGVILSALGIEEKTGFETPKKKTLFTFCGAEISLAHVINFVISQFVVILIILLEFGVIPAVKQGFYCGDPLISHKYLGDTITPEVLGFSAAATVVLTIVIVELIGHQSFKKINPYVVVFYIQEALVGTVLILLLTSVAKVIVGEHRPHFFDICEPDTALNCTVGQFIETYTCTSKKWSNLFLVDASLSFPSGHSSITWFIGIFMCYIIHTRLTTINTGYVMKPFLMSVVLTWSLLCSLSRITDRRHHWWDVLTGSILGILGSFYYAFIVSEKLKTNGLRAKGKSSTEQQASHINLGYIE